MHLQLNDSSVPFEPGDVLSGVREATLASSLATLVGLDRAEQLLDDGETPVHAWFAAVRSYERMLSGDPEGARPWARRAIDLGSTHDAAAAAVVSTRGQVSPPRLEELRAIMSA